jgi:hypothetical protein
MTNDIKLDDLTEREVKKRLQIYRAVFSTPDGLKLLRYLLCDFWFFRPFETDEQRALNEYGKQLVDDLKHAGLDLTAHVTLEKTKTEGDEDDDD